MSALLAIWRAAKPLRMVAVSKAGQAAQRAYEEGDLDMSRIRDLKRNALTRAQRKERREQGGFFWRFRDDSRPLGAAFQQLTNPEISGNAEQEAAPVVIPPNLGQNLPGPGQPGSRRQVFASAQPVQAPRYGNLFTNPVVLALLGTSAFFLFRKR